MATKISLNKKSFMRVLLHFESSLWRCPTQIMPRHNVYCFRAGLGIRCLATTWCCTDGSGCARCATASCAPTTPTCALTSPTRSMTRLLPPHRYWDYSAGFMQCPSMFSIACSNSSHALMHCRSELRLIRDWSFKRHKNNAFTYKSTNFLLRDVEAWY